MRTKHVTAIRWGVELARLDIRANRAGLPIIGGLLVARHGDLACRAYHVTITRELGRLVSAMGALPVGEDTTP